MSVRLYVGNLPEEVDKQALEEKFAEVSKPSSMKLVTDRKTGKCRGFAFVTVESDEIAEKYITALNNADFGSGKLKVEVAQSRTKEGGEGRPSPKSGRRSGKSSGRGGSSFVDKSSPSGPDPRWAAQLQQIKEQLNSAQV
ncbi:MAG: RNA recognition motif domain-containing protein [Synechococcus sp.]